MGLSTACDYLPMFKSSTVVNYLARFVHSDISMMINVIYEVESYVLYLFHYHACLSACRHLFSSVILNLLKSVALRSSFSCCGGYHSLKII